MIVVVWWGDDGGGFWGLCWVFFGLFRVLRRIYCLRTKRHLDAK